MSGSLVICDDHRQSVLLPTARGVERLGCEVPKLVARDESALDLRGTLFANDKSKGAAWLISLDAKVSMGLQFPLVNGNHESSLSPDKRFLAIPHYETTTDYGQGEGGGAPARGVTLLDMKTGIARTMTAAENPFGSPKPHGAAWTDDGDLLVTAQLANGVVKYSKPLQTSETSGEAMRFDFGAKGCHTPHLVKTIPNSSLAVSGCRCTNPGEAQPCPGRLVLFDTGSGAAEVLDSGIGSEGIAVTSAGDVWLGARLDNYVSVFSFGDRPRRVGGYLKRVDTIKVPGPLRIAYEAVNDVIAVASQDWTGTSKPPPAKPNLYVYNASNRSLPPRTSVVDSVAYGRINMEGLAAFTFMGAKSAQGFLVSGGFDNQVLVVIDASNSRVILEVQLPACTLPFPHYCSPTVQPNGTEAGLKNMSGANNWSGGYCPATLRDTFERRFLCLDGFNWSPIFPEWALGR
eukprot:gene18447-22012_t